MDEKTKFQKEKGIERVSEEIRSQNLSIFEERHPSTNPIRSTNFKQDKLRDSLQDTL